MTALDIAGLFRTFMFTRTEVRIGAVGSNVLDIDERSARGSESRRAILSSRVPRQLSDCSATLDGIEYRWKSVPLVDRDDSIELPTQIFSYGRRTVSKAIECRNVPDFPFGALRTRGDNRTPFPRALPLLEAMCTCGALSVRYLRAQWPLRKFLLHGLDLEGCSTRHVVRRAIITREAVLAHTSITQVGCSTWAWGELVSRRPGLGRSLAKEFISAVGKVARTGGGDVNLLLYWDRGHPFWREVEGRLRSRSRGATVLSYVRILGSEPSVTADVSWLEAGDVPHFQQRIRNADLPFLQCLGFSIPGFGSPKLRAAIDAGGRNCTREYVHIGLDSGQAVAVLTQLPLGTQLSRTCDIAWVFPLDGTRPRVNDLASAISAATSGRGVRTPGLFLVGEGDMAATKHMNCFIASPDDAAAAALLL